MAPLCPTTWWFVAALAMVQILVKQKKNLKGLVNCRVCPLVPPFPVAASYLGQHISATSGTKRNQDRNQASLLPPLGQHVSATSGTKWNQDRNQATLHGFLGPPFSTTFGTKWNQDGNQATLLGFLGQHVAATSGTKWNHGRNQATLYG